MTCDTGQIMEQDKNRGIQLNDPREGLRWGISSKRRFTKHNESTKEPMQKQIQFFFLGS